MIGKRHLTLLSRFAIYVVLLSGAVAKGQERIADDWPNRPIRLIVPSAAGGVGDITSRLLAQRLTEKFGQQVVVENRNGGNGTVGSSAISNAPADGYTIGLITASTHAAAPALFPALPYDAIKDFAPISLIASLPIVLAVNPKLPVRTLADFVALAKSKPKVLSNAWGASQPYLAALLFCKEAGIELNHIPYKGTGQAAIDLMEGRIDAQFGTLASVLPFIREGKLRALAVTSASRTPALPDVPTVAEALIPGFDSPLWMGYAAPAATPRPIIEKLNRELVAVLSEPSIKNAFADQGVDVAHDTPDDLAERMKRNIEAFREVVTQAGLHLDRL